MPTRSAADSLSALRAALEAQLRQCASLLAQEVRDYPTPIARCDDQLTGLLERRSRVFHVLEGIDALPAGDTAGGLAALEACAARLAPADLDTAFMAQWRAALATLRGEWRARAGGCAPADVWVNDGGPVA